MEADRDGFVLTGATGMYVNPLSAHRSKRRVTFDVASLVEPAKERLRSAFDDMAEGGFTYETVAEKGNEWFCQYCDLKSCCPVDRFATGRTKAATAATETTGADGTGAAGVGESEPVDPTGVAL